MGKGRTSTILAGAAGGAVLGPVGVLAGVLIAKGQAHRKADDFRTRFQDPLHLDIAGILDPLTAAREAGSLKYEDVLSAQTKFDARLEKFDADALKYELSGGDQQRVVKQARTTLDPIIASWKKGFETDIARLKPAAPATGDLGEAPTLDTILGGVAAQKKRAAPPQGRSSTILGGAATYGSGRQPVKTLLGY